MARMESVWRDVGPEHGDFRSDVGVRTERPRVQRPLCCRVEVRHHLERMHAGVGAAGSDQFDGLVCDLRQRALQFTLHAARVRLELPAGERRAVVLDAERETRHEPARQGRLAISRSASWRWVELPSCNTSSRMLRAPSGSPMSMYARARSSLVPTSLIVAGSPPRS